MEYKLEMDNIPELVNIPEKISVIIITGFLGSGKTTFLNHILRENHGKRIVVIQNEFGDRIGLEEAMVVNKNDVMEWIEFPNGCLCCTVKTDMLIAIEKLVEKNPDIDSIIIETDGLADPEPIIRSLWVDSELESVIELQAVICIVDAGYFLKQLNLSNTDSGTKYKSEAYRQVALADIVLINKIDKMANIAELENIISTINPVAKQYPCLRAQIPIREILDTNVFNGFDIGDDCDCHCHTDEKLHDPEVRAITITNNCEYTIEVINKAMAYLLWEQSKMAIYRIKGLVNIKDSRYKYNLQAVMQTFELEKSGIQWDASESRINKIVFIGKNLDTDSIPLKNLKN